MNFHILIHKNLYNMNYGSVWEENQTNFRGEWANAESACQGCQRATEYALRVVERAQRAFDAGHCQYSQGFGRFHRLLAWNEGLRLKRRRKSADVFHL